METRTFFSQNEFAIAYADENFVFDLYCCEFEGVLPKRPHFVVGSYNIRALEYD